MSIDLSDNNPRVEYSVAQGVTQTSFAIPFEFFDDSDVKIYVDGALKTEGVDYTLTGGDGSTGNASISVTGTTGGSIVIIVRRIALERVTDFTAGSDINRAALNQQLDSLVAIAADLDDRIDRAIHIPDDDPADITFELPVKAARANKYLAFGVDGDVVVTSGTTSDIIVSSFAETFLDDASGAAVLNTLGVTSTPAELNLLDGVTASTAELNILDGVTATTAELNYVDGVTSAIQTQLDGKAADTTQDQATWEAGTDTTETIVSPAKVKAAIDALAPLSKFYESAEQTITAAGSLTLAHGLGTTPLLVQPFLICKGAELGYSIGDIVALNPNENAASALSHGQSISLGATNIDIRFGSTVGVYQIMNKTTGAAATLVSLANWRFFIRAWA